MLPLRAHPSLHTTLHTTLHAGLLALAATTFTLTAGAQTAPPAPVNDLPNPYQTIVGWAKLPKGREWGSTSAVAIDKDGKHIWVAERCGANSCASSEWPSVLKFDPAGNLVKAFGEGMIMSPHGIHVDRDNNVWVVDCSCTGGVPAPTPGAPPAQKRGHQIFKFSPDGKLLMTLGALGGGRDTAFFWQPNALVTAPNGDIFVAEGHSSRAGANARLFKFDKTGKLLKTWGTFGKGPTDLDQPHALALDSRGRLFVGDRGNDRIFIMDQNFTLLDTWYQFSRPSGIFIDKNDMIYVADSESGSVNPPHGAWKRGIRIGSARDGKVTAFIPDPEQKPASTSSAEGVAVDAAGNIYGAEVGQKALKRYQKK
jgi:DNA-binding beta-propeller fold protein YncE